MQAEHGLVATAAESSAPADARAPRSVEETGLSFLFLTELVLKVLFQRGQVRLPELAVHIKLSISVITPLVTFLRDEKLCEVTRSGHSGTDADLTYHLTDAGALRATACLNRNAYAGPAPVTLAAYVAQVATQSVRHLHVTRADVAGAFSDVVASQGVLDQMGAAMNSGRAMFIYGQAGSGKTFLAERLCGLLHGAIAVPYAIMIDAEVVPFYDPVQHQPVAAAASAPGDTISIEFGDRNRTLDARWVRGLQRPTALTGGELTMEMLDLRFDANTRLYQAPPHLKANNGIFIIDDLGRQRCSPLELMNRWIVPMDRGVDYLSLHTGLVFQVPFDVVVVFSSNFLPERLSDGAFLRRLGYKIEVPPQTQAEYELLFRQACTAHGMAFDADAFAYLLNEHHAKDQTPLLACYPRDLIRQVRDLARYENTQPKIDRRSLDWAWQNYFAGAGARRVAAEQQKKERERRDSPILG
ncbi:ATP-binding protein [Duganella dendranthematis]|jgi:predicted ATPase with chaperone activity|uniref:ATP-binding protein n=1 Tax=Duganella dendranthematis TaxID=2728021 RepID=A0ABX6M690_9BURK|nr:ATP-binding protein [Duganella dendranthematis]QJD89655.1 ATP-binding protein [Duganella dendranthematis]